MAKGLPGKKHTVGRDWVFPTREAKVSYFQALSEPMGSCSLTIPLLKELNPSFALQEIPVCPMRRLLLGTDRATAHHGIGSGWKPGSPVCFIGSAAVMTLWAALWLPGPSTFPCLQGQDRAWCHPPLGVPVIRSETETSAQDSAGQPVSVSIRARFLLP